MGCSIGYDDNWSRDVGYMVPSICDHPDCDKKIDRGLAYVCGGEPYGGDRGCGLYFCENHRMHGKRASLCQRCGRHSTKGPFTPKPDTEEWTNHKMIDPSWAAWRTENSK